MLHESDSKYVIFGLRSFQVNKKKLKEIMCEYNGNMSLKFEKKKNKSFKD